MYFSIRFNKTDKLKRDKNEINLIRSMMVKLLFCVMIMSGIDTIRWGDT